MKYSIQINPICPFINRECTGDGYVKRTPEGTLYRPCMFFDDCYQSDVEPCKLKRAINRINKEPDFPSHNETVIEVPWNETERGEK